ncbi:LPXTG-domain-containing protein cell wall anchor domain [Spizellomyces punctatus DAOM BR117]|uniref:LPXTG-domain-containing protein cell wall anchor domain n=1 Tax=Spizellomyces punctatus (strain DAOM BR117) TaxID=645134 RepID=A0A0L0HA52_SPIPD|nr:LPXTG-domain-containing protein cell wall anchor domain [Spizellomyces punctatus DAOM BR117]KNC97548.1 LPXTG-domain-containing protein cell wall anchor domain [Spizellomyces punctatus DAOM BR117]|eukprot:XP_016605588.1 LPXTG-domain-containing protein cell wall anchor domain [Spizellomyces punctatus DAOM BR117]
MMKALLFIALVSGGAWAQSPCELTDRICLTQTTLQIGSPFSLYLYFAGFQQKDPAKWTISLFKGDLRANPQTDPCRPGQQLIYKWEAPPFTVVSTNVAKGDLVIDPKVVNTIAGDNQYFFQATDGTQGVCPMGPFAGVTHVQLALATTSSTTAPATSTTSTAAPTTVKEAPAQTPPAGVFPTGPTAPATASSSSSSSPNVGLIVGVIFVALIILSAGGLFFFRRKRKNKRNWGMEGGAGAAAASAAVVGSSKPNMSERKETIGSLAPSESASLARLVSIHPDPEDEIFVGPPIPASLARPQSAAALAAESTATAPLLPSLTTQPEIATPRLSSATDPFSDVHADPFSDPIPPPQPPPSSSHRRSILASLHLDRDLVSKTPVSSSSTSANDRHAFALMVAQAFRKELNDPQMEWDRKSGDSTESDRDQPSAS